MTMKQQLQIKFPKRQRTKNPISPNSMISVYEARNVILHHLRKKYQEFGMIFRNAESMTNHIFQMTLQEYFEAPFTDQERKLYYKINGNYSNGVKI